MSEYTQMEKEFRRLVDSVQEYAYSFGNPHLRVSSARVEEAKQNLIDHVLKWIKQGDK